MGLSYTSIRQKYGEFSYPMASLSVGGKLFSDNKKKLVLSDLAVDLSTGIEASAATFSIYNVFDVEEKKYLFSNFKEYVQLGSQVGISFGYSDQMTEVFKGFITQARFMDDGINGHHVEITAMDVKGMMMSNSCVRQMSSDNYGDAVREIFRKPVYEKMKEYGIFTQVKVTDTPDKSGGDKKDTPYTVEMVAESDYEFVVKAAKRFNYEFFIDNGVIYFRKAKAVTEDCLIELGAQKGILNYDITYDITGLVKSVEVRGMDTAKAQMVSAVSKASNKISTGNKAKALINQTQRVVTDAAATTKEQAQYRADSLMEEISYRFGTLECTCIGLPELKPGHYIKINDLGTPCDNKFYVTNVRHIITDADGYITQLTAIAALLT